MEQIKKYVLERLDAGREVPDEEILALIDEAVCARAREHPITVGQRRELRRQSFDSLRRLDVLQELIEDDSITEIMVNGAGKIFLEREGRLILWEKHFSSRERLEDMIQQIAGAGNRMVNEYSPIVDTRLSDGSRVNIVLSPISIGGSCISIRKFPKHPILMPELVEKGSIGENAAEFLKKLVKAGYNIFISGGTGSGKTTFLNALSAFIPVSERVITIEDSAELQIQNISNLVRLETRNANVETGKEITIRDLIRTALRMRPDRLLVGEIRGPEALDMLQAMNTGHDGSLSTGHSNGCSDMIRRIETMVLMGMELPLPAIRAQIASGIDILVHLGRLRDRSRRVLAVEEVAGLEAGEVLLHPLFLFREKGLQNNRIIGSWEQVGSLKNTKKLASAGVGLEEPTAQAAGKEREIDGR